MSDLKATNQPGKFIALEGIDGSGKSTQVKRLMTRLRELDIRCHETKEPTDSPIGSLIRQILAGRLKVDNRVIASLFAADRMDHLLNETGGLREQFEKGVTVVTDRYYFSSYAYHSVDMDMDWVIHLNAISAEILRPTVTVFLDVPVEKALDRIRSRRHNIELFEKEERLKIVREKYYEAFEKLKEKENVVIVDASGHEDAVAEKVWESVAGYFT